MDGVRRNLRRIRKVESLRPQGDSNCRFECLRNIRVGDFEWDNAKAYANVRKHGVAFEEAMTVFLDQLAVPFEERTHPDRLVLLGESQLGRTVLVVFTERVASGTIQIISTRRATKRERQAYAERD